MTDTQLEEILQKHDSVYSGPMLPKDIISAMKEAMRIESEAFGLFLNRNAVGYGHNKWIYLINGRPIFTTDQLYNEYLKSQDNDKEANS